MNFKRAFSRGTAASPVLAPSCLVQTLGGPWLVVGGRPGWPGRGQVRKVSLTPIEGGFTDGENFRAKDDQGRTSGSGRATGSEESHQALHGEAVGYE